MSYASRRTSGRGLDVPLFAAFPSSLSGKIPLLAAESSEGDTRSRVSTEGRTLPHDSLHIVMSMAWFVPV